jgi:hypothetical protein
VIVRSSDESLGLEVDTSEGSEERLSDEGPDVEAAEETGSSNDSENEPSSPFTPKSRISTSQIPSKRQEEESATGKPVRQ